MANKEKDQVREAKLKAARFCAYRERAREEVRRKLGSYGLKGDQLEKVLQELTDENFVNDQRFANAYASGKLRVNKWGKLKIKMGLEGYRLEADCIEKALEALPDDEYMDIMGRHIEKKMGSLKEDDTFVRNHKVARFVIAKGFEPDLVWRMLRGC